MNELIRVKLTKLNGKPDSSIQPGYWVIGFRIVVEPTIGKPYMLMPVQETSKREWWFDWFSTTAIVSYENGELITSNSTWKLEEV